MNVRGERRKSIRIKTKFETLFSEGRVEGFGILSDISYTGAQVTETSAKPDLGQQIHLYVFVQPVSPFKLLGTVVRLTENGFCIEYKEVDSEIRRLVDDASAIVKFPQ